MKKTTTLVLLLFLVAGTAWSQGRLGIKGGLNFNSLDDITSDTDATWNRQTGYHLGLTYQAKLPVLGLALQPELMFERKKSENMNAPHQSLYMDYLTLPLNIQIGLDLLLFRPFVMVSPYISYAMGKGDFLSNASWDDINRLDYGYALGGGIDIWRLQVTGKYVWGLGKLQDATSQPISGETFKDGKMEGFQLSVAWMF
jgi:hypothetical protein